MSGKFKSAAIQVHAFGSYFSIVGLKFGERFSRYTSECDVYRIFKGI